MTPSLKSLDFIVIGAQKCGTTSLFRYLEPHPTLYLPPKKEAPFFNLDSRFNRGLASYLEEFFRKAPNDALWGTVTPDYMADSRVPERMAATLPRVKLIAILRDPIERAFSHYRMSVRRGRETRSFEVAIREQVRPEALSGSREKPDPVNSYVIRGEYARILKSFYGYFSPDQMMVLFLNELRETPGTVIRRLFEFLDVNPDFEPSNLNTVYHRGSFRPRWPWANRLKNTGLVRKLWHLAPRTGRRRLSYWFDIWNTSSDSDCGIPITARNILAEHYSADHRELEMLLKCELPWKLSFGRQL